LLFGEKALGRSDKTGVGPENIEYLVAFAYLIATAIESIGKLFAGTVCSGVGKI